MDNSLKNRLATLVQYRYPDSINRAAREIGVPQPTLHGILSGRTKEPRPSVLRTIADHFGVSVDWLLSGLGEPAARVGDRPLPATEKVLGDLGIDDRVRGYWLGVPGVLTSLHRVVNSQRRIGDYPKGTQQAVHAAKRHEFDAMMDRSAAVLLELIVLERGAAAAKEAISRPDVLASIMRLHIDSLPLSEEEVRAHAPVLERPGVGRKAGKNPAVRKRR